MKYIQKLFLTIICCLVIACTQKKTNPCLLFDNKSIINSTQLEFNDNNYLIRPFLLEKIDSFLITTDIYENKLYTAINLVTRKTFRFGHKGNGPGEFLIGTFCSRFNTSNSIVFFNSPTKYYYKVPFDSFIENPDFRPVKKQIFKSDIRKLYVLCDSLFIAEKDYGNNRLALYDNFNRLRDTTLNYPQNEVKLNRTYLRMAYQGKICTKPNDLKFVYITYNSSNIGFYGVRGDSFYTIKEILLQNPSKELNSIGEMNICIPNEDCKIGYLDVYATENFVYALYNDEMVNKYKSVASDVLVFDWNGKPIKILELDKQVSFICVSENDSIIYAISSSNEIPIILSYKTL